MASKLFQGKLALITGGSSGIGFELARLFMRDGAGVVLVASRADRLEAAAASLQKEFGPKPLILVKDLAAPSAPFEIRDELAAKKIPIDVLVNNAGFGLYGKFAGSDLERTLKMIDVNVKAPVALTKLFLPGMIERGFGRVLNVASTAAFQPVPIESVYAASKAFFLLFSEGIANELKGSGVRMTCLCPGPTRTDFFNDKMFPSKMVERTMMPPARVAAIGYDALKKGRPLVVAGWLNRAAAFSVRLAPRKAVAAIARRVVE